jgi:capsular polysaccharide biosynthesis protein
MTTIKARVRKLLEAPFSFSRTIDASQGETYEVLGTCETGLREDERMELEPIVRKFSKLRWKLTKFIYTVRGDIVLDTSLGWALLGMKVLHYSNSSQLEQIPNPHKPNFLSWVRKRRTAVYYPEVVWMPYGTGNYWHFLNDFVGAIYLLKDVIEERKPVVLIHEKLTRSPFFQELVSYSAFLSGLNLQPYTADTWVRCSSFITARTYYGNRESLQDAIRLLNRKPVITARPLEKIFISRAPTSYRPLRNLDELNDFFSRNGFRVVLFDSLLVREQMELINSAKVIAAIHGAGMVNLAFHQQPTEVTVIEITPEDYLNPCFAFLAEELGMDYHCVGAGPRDPAQNNSCNVPIDEVEKVLSRLHLLPITA